MSGAWPWLALAGLGMSHAINPAMGWLVAVGLGMHRGSRAVVLWALIPIALGHAFAIGVVVAVMAAIGAAADAALLAVDAAVLQVLGGLALVGWGLYHQLYGSRHRSRVGMRAGFAGLTLWSFLM